MKSLSASAKRKLAIAAVAVAVVGAGSIWAIRDCDVCMAQLSGTIPLSGIVGPVCSIGVTPLPAASSLNLTGGATRIRVGVVAQSCNNVPGYTLSVTSANCAAAPTGAKVQGPVPATDYLAYSVEFDNPATGGSSDVTGLLAAACAGQTGRDVTGVSIFAENSDVYLNYTGSALLSSGTYQDTLTVTMVTKP